MEIDVKIQSQLARLNVTLAEYAKARRMDPVVALDKKANFIWPRLYEGYAKLKPKDGEIVAEAKARGWRMGRRKDAIRGISKTAWKRAESILGGASSLMLTPGGQVILVGKRKGRVRNKRGAARTARLEDVYRMFGRARRERALPDLYSPTYYAKQLGYKVVGRYAFAVRMEAGLREHGKGFLAASWLHKRWKRLAAADPRRAEGVSKVLVANNPKSRQKDLGRMELVGIGGADGGAALSIVSYVDGADQPRGLEVIARAIKEEADSTQEYLLSRAIDQFSRSFERFAR